MIDRRQLLRSGAVGLGSIALGSLERAAAGEAHGGLHHAPKAKRVIYLFQSGAPSQFETLDPKPGLVDHFGEELPLDPQGAAPDDDDVGPDELPGDALDVRRCARAGQRAP